MAFNPDAVLARDNGLCRLRYGSGCRKRATRVLLADPEFLGGPNSFDNAIAACDHCCDKQLEIRNRAAQLFNYHEGW